MNNLFKILGSIFFAVWTVIGVIALVGLLSAYAFIQSGTPAAMMQSMMGITPGSTGASMRDLKPEVLTCVKNTVGQKRFDEFQAGAMPNKEEQQKLMTACRQYLDGQK